MDFRVLILTMMVSSPVWAIEIPINCLDKAKNQIRLSARTAVCMAARNAKTLARIEQRVYSMQVLQDRDLKQKALEREQLKARQACFKACDPMKWEETDHLEGEELIEAQERNEERSRKGIECRKPCNDMPVAPEFDF